MRLSRVFASTVLLLSLIPLFQGAAHAQAPAEPSDLFKTVQSLDTALFNAVNHCDMQKVATFWAEDAVFLHDKVPPMHGRDVIVASIKDNLCGKVVRELVPGSLEVYPVKDYGAVEIGVHKFLHPYEQDHGVVGEAKFIHLWQYKDGVWRITQVISFDHHLAQ